jgi:hypothetical protein
METRFRSLTRIYRTKLVVALVLLGSSLATMAQSATFAVSQNGKPVGTASYTFAPNSGGFDSTSMVRVNMQGLSYQLSKNEELSANNALKHVQLSAIVNNSAVNVVAKPDAAQFLLNISANGRSSTTRLDAHNLTVFLADFDPALLKPCSRWLPAATIATCGPSFPNRPVRSNRSSWLRIPMRRAPSTESRS